MQIHMDIIYEDGNVCPTDKLILTSSVNGEAIYIEGFDGKTKFAIKKEELFKALIAL